jgi:hypothetical protein
VVSVEKYDGSKMEALIRMMNDMVIDRRALSE